MSLDRQSILDAKDLKIEEVQVPEWGGSIFVRVMTGVERDQFVEENSKPPKEGDKPEGTMRYCAKTIIGHACDAEGKRIFTADDLEPLLQKSRTTLANVTQAILRVNGLNKEGTEKAEKN